MIPLFRPSLDKREIDSVSEVIKSGWLGNGPKTKEFEKKFLKCIGARYGIALNSASAALHLALLCLNLKTDDEVITPSLTFVATNHPILMVGAKPVFCDVEYDTLCANPKDIEKKITKKTKAVIVVHYGGHPVDLSPIIAICKKRKISLIEDCAHAVGSYYKGKHVGTLGDFACFSFAAIKNVTTGDGGMLVGKEKKLIEKARVWAWSGISTSTWERAKGKKLKWNYTVSSIGWKYQMNDIAAAIGLVQLKKLEDNNKKRKEITQRYNTFLEPISWMRRPIIKPFVTISYHNYVIKVSSKIRDRLSDYLAKKDISTSVHYFPSHYYSLYSHYPSKVHVTEKVWKEILLLPLFPDLSLKDQMFVIETIKKFNP